VRGHRTLLKLSTVVAIIVTAQFAASGVISEAQQRYLETDATVMTPPQVSGDGMVAGVYANGMAVQEVVVPQHTNWGDTVNVWVDQKDNRLYPFANSTGHAGPVPSQRTATFAFLACVFLIILIAGSVMLTGSLCADWFRETQLGSQLVGSDRHNG
jgi:hypothetical protein